MRKSYNTCKRRPTYDNQLKYKRYRARARRIFKESKRSAWTIYVSSATNQTPTADVRNKLNKIKGLKVNNSSEADVTVA